MSRNEDTMNILGSLFALLFVVTPVLTYFPYVIHNYAAEYFAVRQCPGGFPDGGLI